MIGKRWEFRWRARQIWLASPEDAEQIQAIYAPIVLETAISFEFEPPSAGEIGRAGSRKLWSGFHGSCARTAAGSVATRTGPVYVGSSSRRSGVGRAQ